MKNTFVFSTEKYSDLSNKILKKIKASQGDLERKYFPDGERYLRINSSILGKDIIIVGGTVSEADTLEIYDLACACSKYGAKKITLVIPFFGYSTMERAIKTGEVVPAKTRARLLSSIPKPSEGISILLLDLHSEGIPYYFENDINVFHLYSKPILIKKIKKISKDFILASTDAGRAKWVESLAKDLNVQPAFAYKKRISGSETEITGVNADVLNKDVIIYDDMIRTGSSLINAARAYKKAGAKNIYAITTHGVFPEGSIEKIKSSDISKVISSNSHPNSSKLDEKDIFDISEIFSDFILKNQNYPRSR